MEAPFRGVHPYGQPGRVQTPDWRLTPASRLGSRFAVAADLPLVGRQPLERDRAASVEAAGRDADFGAEAELPSVGELGRGVDHHDGAVDFGEEALGNRRVLS